ncbi:protein translocase subunit SecF [Desulfosporosinus nitroreducens]|uniref:Protein-export membrane protein SecF n=1 Tax=Desulfosporosinus nitroreducens TaxID=2018668 RepID=A0ABT8QNY3_9FIRM|nr:protein translocase subunit SecF [Desulfosporosinus nitroreducens]MCO1600135.1 protein translocase subunit SecF [Desulfosporosinus nitroreducens]MDO0822835.1 protein translocase subunit SecF [Desulfosporosinus nitroreducens]
MMKTGHPATYEEVKKVHPLYFNIMKRRYWWFALSLLVLIPGIISLFMQGLNLGIDFKGGSMLDITFNKPVTQAAITDTMKSVGLEGPVQLSNGDTSALIRTEALEEEKRNELLAALETNVAEYDKNSLGDDKVGPAMGQELTRNALWALLIAIGLMIGYITIRFQFVFAISAIIALLHDVLIVVGAFSLLQWEIDSTFVAAILTVFGYSINDTVIIFDRIRENEAKMKRADSYEDMADKSVWQTMRRSINTSLTVLIALLSIFIFGGESTKLFSLAMLIGVFVGAYSSIFIASPILLEIKQRMRKSRRGGKAVRA